MSCRAPLVLLAASLLGCASSDHANSDSPREIIWGGQTGSLVPSCGLRQPVSVPEDSGGFVVDTLGCSGATAEEDVEITTADGQTLGASWLHLGDGKYFVVPERSLAPGTYEVSVGESPAEVTVVEPSPVPTRVGELVVLSTTTCGANLELRLDPALRAYAPLLQLTVTTNGQDQVWGDFGEVSGDDATLLLSCDGQACQLNGASEVTVNAELAGRTLDIEGATVRVDVRCGSDVAPSCSAARPAKTHAAALVGGMALALFGLRRWPSVRKKRAREKGSTGRGK
jgi:hypothetical protein